MLRNGIILIFRKFKTHLVGGFVFTIGLSIGYTWFISALFLQDWFGLLGAMAIIIATALRSRPMTNKKELGLYKIFGAHKTNIWPFIITQATVISAIATVIALALMGIIPDHTFVNIKRLLSAGAEWLLPLGSITLFAVVTLVFFWIFTQTDTSISKS